MSIMTMDRPDTAEAMAAAFGRSAGDLVASNHPVALAGSATDRIATAQKVAVERDLGKVMRNIKVMAAAVGDDWYYSWPVKNRRTGGKDIVEGPSIKCANNVARIYGNCEIDTRVVDNGDSWIIYARFTDWETGFALVRPFQQRKGQASIKTDDQARLLDMALQIGVSKAMRNVICNALESFTSFAMDEAKRSLVDKIGNRLPEYKERIATQLGKMNVAIGRVEAVVGRTFVDWVVHDVCQVIAQIKAILDGMATIDETWPPEEPKRGDFANRRTTDATEAKPSQPSQPAQPAQATEKKAQAQPEKRAAPAPQASDAPPATDVRADTDGGADEPPPAATATAHEPGEGWELFDQHGELVGRYPIHMWLQHFHAEAPKPTQRAERTQYFAANADTAKALVADQGCPEKLKAEVEKVFGPALW